MTRQQQKEFVKALCANVCKEIVKAIDDGMFPEEWDGHELRRLLADRFEESAQMSRCMRDKRRSRYRDYKSYKLNAGL